MTMHAAAQLGQLLAAARARTGLSTPKLAALTGVSQSQIVRLELGRIASPTAGTLQRLSQALDVPLQDLYALAGIPMPGLQPYLRASYGLTPADAALAQRYIERLAEGYGATGQGPLEGEDEAPLDSN